MKLPHFTQKTYFFPLILALLFLGQFLFISPIGNFALNDDWVHAETIKHWVDAGEFRLMPFAGPTFYVPILYGALLTKIVGFSFTALRISTLILSFFLLLTLFFTLKKLTNKPLLAFLGTLLVWTNPLFYNLSFSFMTDIPSLFFITLGIFAYFKAFDEKNVWYLCLGTIFSLLAAYTRQTGILLLVAAGLYTLVHINDFGFRRALFAIGIPTLLGAGMYAFLAQQQLLPQSAGVHVFDETKEIFLYAIRWIWYAGMYLGISLLALTLPWFITAKAIHAKPYSWVLIGSVITFSAVLHLTADIHFPYVNHYVSTYGIGPAAELLDGELTPWISTPVMWIMSFLSALGAALLGILFYEERRHSHTTRLLFLFSGFYFIILLTFSGFDRYMLPLIVAGVILVAERINTLSWHYSLTGMCLVVLCFVSITGTKQYLDWNRLRWELAEIPRSEGIAVKDIDAGYEWDGWYGYWDGLASNAWGYPPETDPWWIRKLYPNNSRQYIVSFSPLDNYTILEERTISSLYPNNHLYLLKRNK